MDNLVLPYKENNEADSSSDSDSSSASDEENSDGEHAMDF